MADQDQAPQLSPQLVHQLLMPDSVVTLTIKGGVSEAHMEVNPADASVMAQRLRALANTLTQRGTEARH